MVWAILQHKLGEQGWRSGESSRLPLMWSGFKSRRRRHMWVEFVVSSLPCFERFFSGYSGFPLSSKTNTSKFQFDLERRDTFQRFLQELLSALRVNKLQFMESVSRCQYQIYFCILAYVMSSEFTRVMKKISASLTFVLSSICIFIGIFIHLKCERFFSLFQYREVVDLHSLLIMHAGIQIWI